MHFLKKYVRKYWKMFILAVLCLTVEALADLMQPAIMAKIVDIGVASKNLNYVVRMGGLMLLITAFGAIGASSRNILASRVSQAFGAELRADLFRKIQTLSFENIDRFDRASLITRLTNDVTQVQNFVNGLMRIFVKAPLVCIGSLIMAARLNLHLAVILLAVVPTVAVLIALNMKIGLPRFIRVQKALDQVNGVMREYLSGVRVVKAFNRFDTEIDKFEKNNQEYRARTTNAMRTMSVFNPAIMLTVNFGIVAVLWFGSLLVERGQTQVGSIIAFTNYMTQILFSLMMISMVLNMFVRARASAARIEEVFDAKNRMEEQDGPRGEETFGSTAVSRDTKNADMRGRVDFERVGFSYEGTAGPPVLRDVSLTFLPGETVGIIGSTGSGKSSLVGLIPRFYDATKGTIKVNGVDIKTMNPSTLRDKIAIVPQKTVLFTGSITDNVRWGKENATPEEIERAARMAQAHEYIASFPEGYDTKLGQGGVNLSGGQKQRLSIARALVREPEILILDDCTSAVDVATEARIKEALKQYAGKLTCVLIAQRITSVMDADRIIVLDEGEVVGNGNHETLMKSCKVYQEIFQSQLGKELQPNVSSKGI